MEKKNLTFKKEPKDILKSTMTLILILLLVSMLATAIALYYINKIDKSINTKVKETQLYLKEYILLNKISDSLNKYKHISNYTNRNDLYTLLTILKDYSLMDDNIKKLTPEIDKLQLLLNQEDKQMFKKVALKFEKKLEIIKSNMLIQINTQLRLISAIYRQKQHFMIIMYILIYFFSFLMLVKIYYRIKQMKISFKEQMVRIALLSEEKQNFMSTMSHEIRTPLNGIIGIIELLKHKLKDKETVSLLHKLEFASHHLLSLINDILTFSKLVNEKSTILQTDFNIDETISEIAEFFATKAKEKNTELIVKIDPTLPLCVKGDKNKLIQIISNLVNNSVKFTTNGFIRIIVEEAKKENNKIFIKFTIEDSGIGISQNNLKTIFDPFKQIIDPSIKPSEGTGLGLPISKKLVSLLGGDINIKSEVNKGTTITFTLPFLFVKQIKEIYLTTIKETSICIYLEKKEKLLHLYKDLFESFNLKSFNLFTSSEELHAFLKNKSSVEEKLLIFVDTDYLKNEINFLTTIINRLNKNKALCFFGVIENSLISNYIATNLELLTNKKIGFVEKPLTRSKILNIIMEFFYDKEKYFSKVSDKSELTNGSGLKSKKILIVEDNNLNRDILAKLFETIDAKITLSKNGVEALISLNSEIPDLIIMDYHMPFMNGKECAKKIREKGYNIPIILLTGDVYIDSTPEEHKLFDEILTKPVNFQLLLKKSSHLVNKNKSVILDTSTNFSLLRNIYPQKEEFKKVLLLAKKDLMSNFKKLRKSLIEKKYKNAKQMAHTLKGTISYFNSPKTIELLKEIEISCLKEDSCDNLIKLCSVLEKEILNIISIINKELDNNNNLE